MRIDSATAVIEAVSGFHDSIQIQTENRKVIQAVKAVNASDKLGGSEELSFALDRHTRQPVVRIVNRDTNEAVQIPTEEVLRLAESLKFLQ